jgi:tape measure domain-containing protein
MPSLDEVGVRLTAKDDGATRTIRGVREQVAAVGRETRAVGDPSVGRGLSDLGGSFGALSRQVEGLHGGLLNASGALGDFAGRQVRNAALGLGALAAAAGAFGLRASSSFEQSEIAFGTLLGSVEAGNSLFAQLQAYNLKTPFELDQIAQATQTLLQFGFTGDNVVTTLQSISDVAATSANPADNLGRIALAIGQIRSAGVIRGQDLLQLTEAGFPARDLLKQLTGLSGPELQKELEGGLDLPAEEFIAAIDARAGVLSRYAGGAERQAQTLSGVFSNLKDQLNVDLADAVDPLALGLKQAIPEIMKDLNALVTTVAPPLTELFLTLLNGAAGALTTLTPVLEAIATGVGEFAAAAGPGLVGLRPVALDLADAFGDLFDVLVDNAPELTALFVGLVEILPDLIRLVAELAPVVGTLADGLGQLLAVDGVTEVMAGLLLTLLAYRALAPVIGIVVGMSSALTGLAAAQTAAAASGAGAAGAGAAAGAAGAGAGAAAGRRGLGRGARGGIGGLLLGGGLLAEPSLMGDASTIGGGALAGSAFGVPGALVGTAVGGGVVLGRRLAAGDREDAMALAPSVPSGVGASQVTYSRQTTVEPGAVTVLNPTSNVDVAQAVQDGIRAYEDEQDRRN